MTIRFTSASLTALACVALAVSGCQCQSGRLLSSEGQAQVGNLDFGEVLVRHSEQLTLSLINNGSSQLSIENVSLAGANPGDFRIASDFPDSVEPGTTVTAQIAFTPGGLGPRSATISFQTDSGVAPIVTAQFKGSGITFNLTVSPNPLDFGEVQVGAGPATLNLQLDNTSNIPLQIHVGSIAGSNASVFSAGTAPTQIAAGGLASLPISFQPTSVGPASAILPLTLCATGKNSGMGCMTQGITLRGTGVDSQIVFTPVPISFPAELAGSTEMQAVTLTNTGTADVTLTSLATQSGSSSVFSVLNLPATPLDLPAGQSLMVSVQYTATAAPNGDSDTLVAAYTASGTLSRTATDRLVGYGQLSPCTLAITPHAVAFGAVKVGSQATSQVTLANSGQSACQISAVALSASTDPAFTVDPNTPTAFIVPPTSSATITVDFFVATAKSPLLRTGTLTFQTTDPSGPTASVPLSASLDTTSLPCSLTVSPASLAYGTVQANTPTTLAVTLTNVGISPCSVTNITLGAGTDPDFTLSAPTVTMLSIASGANATIGVVFDAPNTNPPSTHGGTLTFATNDATQPTVTVPLRAQTPSPYSGGWPKWHNDNTNQGRSIADTSGLTGTVAWMFNVGAPPATAGFNPFPSYMNSPVVGADGTIYQVGMSGTLYAVSPMGAQIWSTPVLSPASDPHPATPIIDKDNSIFVETGADTGGTGGDLYHVAPDGGVISQTPPPAGTDGFDVCPSLSNGGFLLDGDDTGVITAYSIQANGTLTILASGAPIMEAAERVSVAVGSDDTSYWCIGNYCAARSSPSLGLMSMWPSGYIQAAPDGPVPSVSYYIASDLAFDVNTTGYLFIAVGWSLDSVNGQTELVAVNPGTGANVWKLLLPSGPLGRTLSGWFWAAPDLGNGAPAVAADGTVYVGNVDGLYGVNGKTGAIKPGFPFKCANVDSAPAIGGDSTVFFGASDGSFYAVKPDGSQRFKITTGGRVSSSPAIGPDGSVYFVSDDGNLYAVH
jgi:outer membrane protein assembly factor BamB